jgi:type VI secretion system protein VasD
MGMQRLWCGSAAWALLAAVLVVGGCASKPPKPAPARLTVAARADVNPDDAGRPSPVVLRVYQLKDDAAFKDADFFAIFDNEQATLSTSLIDRKEFELAPGDSRTIDFPVSGDAKFLAVLAAFRDIRNASWRALVPAPKKGYKNIIKTDKVLVTAEKVRVTLSVSD